MVIRKTPEQIKEEILTSLDEQPLSIEQLRKKVESNWSTINNYLDELSKEGKVKEIISAEKAKVYQRIFGDTYFDIPITNDERRKFKTLFSMILQEYKSRSKMPTKTHLAKCAVYVIKNEASGLSDLPTIWYLYGLIPQMIADPGEDYQEETKLKNKSVIQKIIQDFITKNGDKPSSILQRQQHKEYEERLYILSDEFFILTNKQSFKNEEILEILNEFFISCPIDNEFPEMFVLTEKVLSLIRKLSIIGVKLEEHRKEIVTTFDSLWKFIALYKLYISKTTGKNPFDKEMLLKFYIGGALDSRKKTLEENILELNSLYLNKLTEFDFDKLKLSEDARNVREIMQDYTGED